jgi:hypothetical protein
MTEVEDWGETPPEARERIAEVTERIAELHKQIARLQDALGDALSLIRDDPNMFALWLGGVIAREEADDAKKT